MLEYTGANVTYERLDVTDAVSGRQVALQVAFLGEFVAANLTVVLGVSTLCSARTRRMHNVVVSAHR